MRNGFDTMKGGIGRRSFLAGLGAVALGSAASRLAPAFGQSFGVSDAAWNGLREKVSGGLLRPGDADFARIASPNNLRYAAIRPAAIARCQKAEDVRQALLWARDNGVPLVARSGGHSYAGYSCTSGLMVDVSPMSAIDVDRPSGVVTLGGGARNGHIYGALDDLDLAVTHGRCMTVGAAAFLLGGGIGFNMRAQGLGCDGVTEAELVTADGEIRTVSAKDDPDLFWAARGVGGGNLGIFTQFRLQTFPVSEVCAFSIEWDQNVPEVSEALLATLPLATDRLGTKVLIGTASPEVQSRIRPFAVTLLGQLQGTAEELRDILAPVYAIANPSKGTIGIKPYWEAQTFLSEDGAPAFYQECSRFLTAGETLATLPGIFAHLRRFPGSSGGFAAKYFQTGGRINTIEPHETAFVHRGSQWLFSIELDWSAMDGAHIVDDALDWQEELYADVARNVKGGAYQNFPDPSLYDPQAAYYGDNLRRLLDVKAKYDPDSFFSFPQAV